MSDPCCFLCSTPSGVCATNRKCQHHREYALKENAGPSRLTYRDSTGDTAARNVDRDRKKNR